MANKLTQSPLQQSAICSTNYVAGTLSDNLPQSATVGVPLAVYNRAVLGRLAILRAATCYTAHFTLYTLYQQ